MTLPRWPAQTTDISQGMSPSIASSQLQEDIEDPNESQGEEELDEDLQADPPILQKRKGGRKPIYATPEERKQRNRQAQAAFRERRTEYIRQLEVALKQNEDTISTLQETHHIATNECLRLRYRNSLLENILLEHGIDLQRELQTRTSSPPIRQPSKSPNTAYPPTAQRAMMNRHQRAKHRGSNETSVKPSVKHDGPTGHAKRDSDSALLLSPLEDSLSFASLDLSTNPPLQRADQFPAGFGMYSGHSSQLLDQIMQQSFPASQLPYSPAATTSDRSETLDAQKGRGTKHTSQLDMTSQGLASPIDMSNNFSSLDFEHAKRADITAPPSEAEPFDSNVSTYMVDQTRQRQAPATRPSSMPSSKRQRNSNVQQPEIPTFNFDDDFAINNTTSNMFPKSSQFYGGHPFANQQPPWG